MDNIDNIMQLCRLCLVKDQVNVPIFGGTNDIEEISSKISSCLPVKVSPDDSLPKKICDDCSYKLDLLYVFRNTSINSEKQLYQWLEQAGISKTTSGTISTTQSLTTPILATDSTIPSVPISTLETVINDTITKSEISVKQEKTESTAGSELSAETQEYLLQQQKLPYQENFGDFNTTGTNSATAETEEPARKKPRRAAASKPPIKDNESDPDVPPTKAEDDSDEDIDDAGDGGGMDDDDDEEEEEDDGLDHPEFVDVPSTSAEEQPGPSGVNKDPIAAPNKNQIQDSLQCYYCSQVYNNKQRLERHLVTHPEYRPYSCQICGESFKWKNSLDIHQCIYDKYKCDICEKTFSNSFNLEYHRRRHTKNYPCEHCEKVFATDDELKQHMSKEHKTLNFISTLCEICGKPFYDRRALEYHMKRHENFAQMQHSFPCEICNKIFFRKTNLLQHNKTVHNDNRRKFVCDLCGKVVATFHTLQFHKNSHEGIKMNECTICGKKFNRKSTLVDHIRIHTGERPYSCSVCNKSFAHRFSLITHMRGHTGEKPHSCVICGDKFITKGILDRHIKRKHT